MPEPIHKNTRVGLVVAALQHLPCSDRVLPTQSEMATAVKDIQRLREGVKLASAMLTAEMSVSMVNEYLLMLVGAAPQPLSEAEAAARMFLE